MRQVTLSAIHHQPWLEYRHALPDGKACLRLRTGKDDFTHVQVRIANQYHLFDPFAASITLSMALAFQDQFFDYYEVVFTPNDPRLRYLFILQSEELILKLDGSGLHFGADAFENINEAFAFAYAYPAPPMPDWARGCVGYQIFPDRFRRAGENEDGLEPWGSDRVQSQFRFGGNLKGILEAVPYLKSLGVQMVYTTPLFLSDTAHRYNTFDYYQIDPLLGTEDDLAALCQALHQNDMRLILDGVFNHCGLAFPPFADALEKGKDSAFYDWFFFDEQRGYHTFSFEAYMPKLNLQNKDCAQYFCDVGKYWMERCGIDGWRMDVGPEVHPGFWRSFRNMMKQTNPDSLLVVECWDDSREWITQGDMFDSTMHYVFSRNLWRRFATHAASLEQFDHAVNQETMRYPHRNQEVLWTFLGNHDTDRFRTRAGGDERMLRAASFFQFTYLGTPVIYYGDELGMEGGADPENRRPMRWESVENNPIHKHFQKLAHLRSACEALRQGTFRTIATLANGLYVYQRTGVHQQLLCVLNTTTSHQRGRIELPDSMAGLAAVYDLYAEKSIPVVDDGLQVSLAPGEGLILE